jgi:gluconate 5-dehydrogenase
MDNINIQKLFDLSGKVAIITGARGLGYQSAETLAELGASVVVTSRDESVAVRAAEKLAGEKGAKTCGIALEATDEDSWHDLVDHTVKKFGRIDILINNAGGRIPALIDKSANDDFIASFLERRSLKDWKYTIDSNLTSAFLGCREVAPFMIKNGYGKIINIASVDGIVGRDLEMYKETGISPTVPDYLAAKAGVINLTRAIAVVLAKCGVYVNCISPGGFYRGHPKEFVEKYAKLIPLGRMARDGIDLKGAVAFLASAASDYVVGHNLVVDGGFTAW